MSNVETLKSILKSGGRSVTKVRLSVFDVLARHDSLTMHQLAEKTPGVDRASVYRAVELFERLGVVQRINTGWKYRLELTDKFSDHHHHLTCTNCGRTISMNETELEQLITKLAASYNFAPSSHQIEIQGLCERCSASRQLVENS